MNESPAIPPFVWKIFREDEWNRFEQSGQFSGSADDARDGFIHLSCEAQVEGTLRKHFSGAGRLWIAKIATAGLPIKMEVSRDDQHFPHLFGVLPWASVVESERRD
jgi:uncharacterized protein (DUF952 family)